MNYTYDFNSASCMLCGKKGLTFVHDLRDDDEHWAARCNSCGHIQLTPLPSIEEDEKYYKGNSQYRYVFSKTDFDDIQLMYRYEAFSRHEVEIIKRFMPKDSLILEIGSGYGWLIEKLMVEGYQVVGVELSNEKCEMARNRANIELQSFNILQDKPPKQFTNHFDCVCFFNLLEHIADPVNFLKQAAVFLKENGRIIVEVPNYNAYMKQYSPAFDAWNYMRAHLSYFTPESLTAVLTSAGLKNVSVSGKQAYSVENAIHWARNNVPFKPYSQVELPEGLEFVNDYFKEEMEKNLTSDSLVAVGTICSQGQR